MGNRGNDEKFFSAVSRQIHLTVRAVEPIARREVLKIYGRSGGEDICPSEELCDKFQSAGGANREEKEQDVCIGAKCPMFPTKPGKNSREALKLETLVHTALGIRRRNRSGYKVETWEMSPAEFQTVQMVDALIEAEELRIKHELPYKIAEVIGQMFKR